MHNGIVVGVLGQPVKGSNDNDLEPDPATDERKVKVSRV